jgi:hypothetical protein
MHVASRNAALSDLRHAAAPLYGRDLRAAVAVEQPVSHVHRIADASGRHLDFANSVQDAVLTYEQRAAACNDLLHAFMFVIPRVRPAPCSGSLYLFELMTLLCRVPGLRQGAFR